MSKLCVFAGTLEGRRLIQALSGRGVSLTASVATGYGESLIDPRPDLTLHTGRMDQNQMREFLEANRFDAVVDATHPYADKVSERRARTTCACFAPAPPGFRTGSTSRTAPPARNT